MAERLGVPLLSADGRLAAALNGSFFEVLTLTELFSAGEDAGNT
ncbi:MAG: type II toxin-antitoxin system VapC family toxin [Armatimonadetes bacterium]|nr:type II toxin-antitoxin system VapC family toxin [Armatimonadota bacterium]NCQ27604.1 type II toxin-antitoxin system VapC family toxin [Armatimonadota bacterium]